MVDKKYCMSSFLMFRTIYDHTKAFDTKYPPFLFEENKDRNIVNNSFELEEILRQEVQAACAKGKAAVALSGGIDSAILAKYMPRGSLAYTFKCIVPGIEVVDETPTAAKYAKECGLEHRIVEIYWEDFEKYAPVLMKHKGAPIHSIEVQIYKAALQAKSDGIDTLIFGESADANFGGQDGLLSKEWTVPEYIERFSYLLPYKVLRDPEILMEPFLKYSHKGIMNAHEFNRHVYYLESVGSYENAAATAQIGLCLPYTKTYLGPSLDYQRIRNGENKYTVREVFKRLYPEYSVPPKTPMPRPMNEWFRDWKGPERDEFIPNTTGKLTGDQKWLVYSLERFLNILEM